VDVSAQYEQPEPPGQPRQRREAEALYDLEMMLRQMGFSDFAYDEEEDLFRFRDGRFAFFRNYADRKLLWKRDHSA
jgi:hypothetical protein